MYNYSRRIGGQMADWVEQALEWAQRICNGESWETVCNKPDTAKWHRLVLWKGPEVRRIGGSTKHYVSSSATYVLPYEYSYEDRFTYTVPLVTFRKD